MFRKPYKVKTSTTMKGSERRTLRSLVENQYPNLSPDDINILIPNKSEMNQVKAMTHGGRILIIYYSGSTPVLFLLENKIYPTVYTLWKYINLLPTITTNAPVLEKICNGADLMAPGVIICESTFQEMSKLKINELCAVRISGNKAPIAVGVALMAANELCVDNVKGKAVNIVHNYKDTLWAAGDSKDLPMIKEPEFETCEEFENLNISCDTVLNREDLNASKNIEDAENIFVNETSLNDSVNKTDEIMQEYTMDEILYNSFMTAIKVHGKKIQFPLLTSTFYSSYVLKSCPSELNLDIKKTTYKKLSVFLKMMMKDGILQIKELTKGVESVININFENENVRSFKLNSLFKTHIDSQKSDKLKEREDTSSNVQENYKFPTIEELFVVSAQVKKLFETANIKKGDSISPSTVREVIKSYVKNNSLQNEKNPRQVILDPILSDCVLKKGDGRTIMTWEEIYEAIVHNMPHAYQLAFDGKDPILKKGKLEPVKITVDIRTGNKKVTLIQNLETYGINPEKIAHHVQVAVAASTTITTVPGGKGNLVLIQGNQVLYLQKLFLDTLKVPRKYIQGLENVPSKKK